MKSIISVVVVATLVSACASVEPLDDKTKLSIRNKSIQQSSRKAPDFRAATPGKAFIGGLVGEALMYSQGNSLIRTHAVADPANQIASALVKTLESSFGTNTVPGRVRVNSSRALDIASDAKGKAAYVMDVETDGWSLGYYPMQFSIYRVEYSAKARLVDTEKRSIVAEGSCHVKPDEPATAPSYETLTANNAELLKKELLKATEFCIKEMRSQLFGLS